MKEFALGTGPVGPPCSAGKANVSLIGEAPLTEDEADPEPTLRHVITQLLEVIQQITTSLTGRVEEVKIDVGLRQDLQPLRGRVREVEDRLSQLEDTTTSMLAKVTELEKVADLWMERPRK